MPTFDPVKFVARHGVVLASAKGPRLTAIRQEHTKTGAHRNVLTPFPKWVPAEVEAAARGLSEADARTQLGPWVSSG
jgi:hypothetical protein